MRNKLKKIFSYVLGAIVLIGNSPTTAFAASYLNPPMPSNYKKVKKVDDLTEINQIVQEFYNQKPSKAEVISYDKTKLKLFTYEHAEDAIVNLADTTRATELREEFKDHDYNNGKLWAVHITEKEADKIDKNADKYVIKGDNLFHAKMYNPETFKFNGREIYMDVKLKEVVIHPNGAEDASPQPSSIGTGYYAPNSVKIFDLRQSGIGLHNLYYFKDYSHRFHGWSKDGYRARFNTLFETTLRYKDTDEKVEELHLSTYAGDVDSYWRDTYKNKTAEELAEYAYRGDYGETFRVDSDVEELLMSNRFNYAIRDKFISPANKPFNQRTEDENDFGATFWARGLKGESAITGGGFSNDLGCFMSWFIPNTDYFVREPNKKSNKPSVNLDEDVTFSITQDVPSKLIRENRDLQSIVIKDALQDGLEFKELDVYLDNTKVSKSDYTVQNSNNTITVSLNQNYLHNTYEKTVKVELTATAKKRVKISNKASVSIDGVEKDTPTVTVVPEEPTIKITKEANKSKVIKGEDIDYTISVENTNTRLTDSFDATITENPSDSIELNLEPFDLKGAENITREDNIFKITGIQPNKKATFKLRAKAVKTGSATNSINLPNQPPITTTTEVVIPQPTLMKTNNAGNEKQKGDEVEFTIRATLPSILGLESDLASDFTITDTLPAGLELIGEVNAPDGFEVQKTTTGFTATKATVDKFGVDATFTYKARITTADLNALTNNATLTGSTFEQLTSNSTVSPVAPHLTITRDIDKSYLVNGDEFTYTYTVTNDGTGTAKKTTLDDVIPSYLERVDGNENNGKLHFDLGDIPVGQSKSVSIKLRLKKDTPRISSVDANASTTCINGNTAQADISTPTEYPVFELTKVADGEKYQIDDTITYTITARQTNTKVSKAYNVSIVDNLPQGLELVEMTSQNGTVNGNSVTYDEFGTQDVITVKAKALANGEHTNVATLNIPNEPETTAENKIKVLEPKFTIEKSADKNLVSIGDDLEYTLKITNTGEVPIRNAEYRDVLEAQLIGKEVSADKGDVVLEDNIVKGSNLNLEVGETATVKIKTSVVVSHELAYNKKILNKATMTVGKIPPVDSNTVEVDLHKPTVEIQKLVDKEKITEEEYATYTLRVIPKNGVPVNVKIHDTLPDKMELDVSSIKSNIGEAHINGQDMRFMVDRLEEPAEITYRAKALENGEHFNLLEVLVPGIPPKFTEAKTVKVATNLEITKEADVSKTYVSEDINYVINVKKDAAIAKNVTVQDMLPKEVELYKDSVKVNTFDEYKLDVKEDVINLTMDRMTQDFTIEYKAKAVLPNGEATNTATVETPDAGKKTAEAKVNIIAPTAQLTKIITNEGKFKTIGDYIEYKVHVTTKDKFVNDLVLTDTLPAGLKLDKDSVKLDTDDKYEITTDGAQLIVNMPTMTKDFTVSYRAKIVDFGIYKNIATLNMPNQPPTTTDATTKLNRPKVKVVNTGDESNIGFLLSLAGASAIGVYALNRKKK